MLGARLKKGRRLALVCSAVLALTLSGFGAVPAAAQDAEDPAQAGRWSAPFEEGGAETSVCTKDENGREVCKPTAVSAFVQPDGQVLYWNGIESSENVRTASAAELSPESRDSRSRVLDLTGSTPEFFTPDTPTGGASNPDIDEGRSSEDCLRENPLGVAGVPGRPGDGLVGSLAGLAGVPPSDPSCPPDDVQQNDADMFCADVVQLADGRALTVGGTDWYNEPSILERAEGDPADVGVIELEGLRSARVYDWESDAWSPTTPMKFGRWYPGAVTLSDGKVLVASGTRKLIKSTQGSQVRRTETYDPRTQEWTENYTGPASENSLPQNPRLFLTPNGKVFYTGSGQMWGPMGQAVDEALFGLQQFFNLETKEWEPVGATVPRSSPAEITLPMEAPYDTMRILSAGGVLGPPPGGEVAVPLSTITTVTGDGEVTTETTGPLNHPRWFSQAVALPDGTVMVTNGADKDEVTVPGTESAVRNPEIFDPETGEWTSMAPMSRDRTYHNSAVLLPDGRVLVGGHSPIPAAYGSHRDLAPRVTANNDKDPSFQIYSPPYLFQGDRPHIDRVQFGLRWGESFTINTRDAGEIEKVILMRIASPQHVLDNDVRTLSLPFERTGNQTLTAQTPPDGTAAPPGYYYLFIDRSGDDGDLIPSVARVVRVGDSSDHRSAIEPMSGAETEGGSATEPEEHTYVDEPPRLPIEDPPGAPDAPDAPGPVTTKQPGSQPAQPEDETPASQGPGEAVLPGSLTSQAGRRAHGNNRAGRPVGPPRRPGQCGVRAGLERLTRHRRRHGLAE